MKWKEKEYQYSVGSPKATPTISITNKCLLEGVKSNKMAGTIVDRVYSLVEIRTPENKPKLGNAWINILKYKFLHKFNIIYNLFPCYKWNWDINVNKTWVNKFRSII